jgi:hypothetical protein
MKMRTLNIKDASMVSEPKAPEKDFGKTLLPSPLTRKPISGKRGMRYVSLVMF